MSLLSHGQEIALEHYLKVYPKGLTFYEIGTLIEEMSDDIVLWAPFREWNKAYLMGYIQKLANTIDKVIVQNHDGGYLC